MPPRRMVRPARLSVDPPGSWDHPAWQAVGFRAVPEGAAHRFSFATELQDTTFVARAHGDLDGDGVVSVFEAKVDFSKAAEPKLIPGMYVEAELE